MASFTAGPWRVDDEGQTGEYSDIWIATEGGGRSIARLGDDPQPDHAQRLADARLIAKAPELYDLLIMLLPYIEELDHDPAYKPRLARQVRALLAAIDGEG